MTMKWTPTPKSQSSHVQQVESARTGRRDCTTGSSRARGVRGSLSAPSRTSACTRVSLTASAASRSSSETNANTAVSRSVCGKEWFWLLFEKIVCPVVATPAPYTTSTKSSIRSTRRTARQTSPRRAAERDTGVNGCNGTISSQTSAPANGLIVVNGSGTKGVPPPVTPSQKEPLASAVPPPASMGILKSALTSPFPVNGSATYQRYVASSVPPLVTHFQTQQQQSAQQKSDSNNNSNGNGRRCASPDPGSSPNTASSRAESSSSLSPPSTRLVEGLAPAPTADSLQPQLLILHQPHYVTSGQHSRMPVVSASSGYQKNAGRDGPCPMDVDSGGRQRGCSPSPTPSPSPVHSRSPSPDPSPRVTSSSLCPAPAAGGRLPVSRVIGGNQYSLLLAAATAAALHQKEVDDSKAEAAASLRAFAARPVIKSSDFPPPGFINDTCTYDDVVCISFHTTDTCDNCIA